MSTRRIVVASLVAFAIPLMARAQAPVPIEGTGFMLGSLKWTPAISLRDVGTDSNIFDTHVDHQPDFTATLTPQVDALLDTPHVRVHSTSVVDVVYFDHYASERSVNRQVTTRIDAPLKSLVPFVSGGYTFTRERQNAELDIRARRRDLTGSLGTTVLLGTRGTVQIGGRVQEATYSDGQTLRGYELADQLNRRVEAATVGFKFAITPLTSFIADGETSRDRYTVSTFKNQKSNRASVGFEFAPDAVLRGRATVGYHDLKVIDTASLPFGGFTADVDLSYVLLGVTRFDARYGRDTTFSVEAPYYLQNMVGLNIQQTFIGPIDLVARGSLQKLEYPGIASRNVDARTDHTEMLGGGIIVRTSRTTRLSFNYEITRRRSPLESVQFERQRLFTSILVGL